MKHFGRNAKDLKNLIFMCKTKHIKLKVGNQIHLFQRGLYAYKDVWKTKYCYYHYYERYQLIINRFYLSITFCDHYDT